MSDFSLSSENGFSDIQLLSQTSHNNVYFALSGGRRVVLKVPRTDNGNTEINRHLLQREWEMLHGLSNPYIVGAQRLGEWEGELCLVLDYVDGRDLLAFVKESPSYGVRRRVFGELLEALEYLHNRQVVHADIKPENILITYDGDHVKLIDLGLSDDAAWLAQNIGCTRPYAAPEQLVEGGVTDCRTDVYALGYVLQLLFPYRFRGVVRRCLAKDPSRRYRSVSALRRTLRRYYGWVWGSVTCVIAVIGVIIMSLLSPSGKGEKEESLLFEDAQDTIVAVHQDTVVVAHEEMKENKPQYDAEKMELEVRKLHERFRDACLDSIRNMPERSEKQASRYFYMYRDSSNVYMYRAIRRFPEHEMEIAMMFDGGDRYIYSPAVLDAVVALEADSLSERE